MVLLTFCCKWVGRLSLTVAYFSMVIFISSEELLNKVKVRSDSRDSHKLYKLFYHNDEDWSKILMIGLYLEPNRSPWMPISVPTLIYHYHSCMCTIRPSEMYLRTISKGFPLLFTVIFFFQSEWVLKYDYSMQAFFKFYSCSRSRRRVLLTLTYEKCRQSLKWEEILRSLLFVHDFRKPFFMRR